MASTSYIKGQEQHVRICIPRESLIPPGQPIYCLSAEGVLNTHCCYTDYCNSVDLQVPNGEQFTHTDKLIQIFPASLSLTAMVGNHDFFLFYRCS